MNINKKTISTNIAAIQIKNTMRGLIFALATLMPVALFSNSSLAAPPKLAESPLGKSSGAVKPNMMFIFDTSGSMEDKIEGVQDAVEHFVKSVAPGDEIFLVRFSDDAELVQDFTDD